MPVLVRVDSYDHRHSQSRPHRLDLQGHGIQFRKFPRKGFRSRANVRLNVN
jgi:hypothetical protein